MQNNMKETIDSGWVAVPRLLLSDKSVGVLTLPEFRVLSWLFISANPYGIARVSLGNITDDVFGGEVTKSWANKIVLSLKSKRYIWFESRNGRRGSFEVHLDNFLLSKGKIRNLDKYFIPDSVRGDDMNIILSESDFDAVFGDSSQSSEEVIDTRLQGFKPLYDNVPVRASNNKKDNKKEKKNESLEKNRQLMLDAMPNSPIKEALNRKISY
jgi:hypothetical protein